MCVLIKAIVERWIKLLSHGAQHTFPLFLRDAVYFYLPLSHEWDGGVMFMLEYNQERWKKDFPGMSDKGCFPLPS